MKSHSITLATLALAICGCNPLVGNSSTQNSFNPGVPSASPSPVLSYLNSTISISSATVASGGVVHVSVDLRDADYNPFISSLPAVSLEISGGTSTGTFSSITNNLDGSYSSTFTGGNFGTATLVNALVDGQRLPVSPSITVGGLSVTSSGDGHETFTPNVPQALNYHATQSFTVTANANYSLSSTVTGTCPSGSWNGSTYTTGPISAECTVGLSAVSLAGASLTSDTINSGSILAYVFKETSGNTLYDISPAANNGTTNGTWAFDFSENKEIQQFNLPAGGSQSISFTSNATAWTGLSQISAYFRVNINNVINAQYSHFFQFIASGSPTNAFYFRPAQNGVYPSVFSCCSNIAVIASSTVTSSYFGSWHDFVVTYNNTSGASVLYTDGVQSNNGNLPPGLLNGTISGFNIFDGDSADLQTSASVVRFWNRTLTGSEALELHTNPMSGVTSP